MKFPEGILRKNFSLKNLTSFKTGGKCDFYFIPNSLEDLKIVISESIKNNIPYYIIGNGTNILFSDKQFKGIIINLKGFLNYIEEDKTLLKCGSAVNLNTVIDFTKTYSLTGIENLAGIPGTIGGAAVMNAGAFGTEIGDKIQAVKVLTPAGKIKTISADRIKFSYRSAKPLDKYIVLEITLQLRKGKKVTIEKNINKILEKRGVKQPLEFPSAGSVFKRPKNNFAGRLIEEAGLKGFKIGGAMISQKHSNFIINTGNAKAQDIYDLILHIQKTVYKKVKIKLTPEIKLINF